MPREPQPLKARTLKEASANARRLSEHSRRDTNPPWGDDQLRRDLHVYAMALDWARRAAKDPLCLILADEADRRKHREEAATREAGHGG